MKVFNTLIAIAVGIMLTASTAWGAETEKSGGAKKETSGFVYTPPMRGAPAARIGGGTRELHPGRSATRDSRCPH